MTQSEYAREVPAKGRRKASLWRLPIFFAVSLIWMESIFRISIYGHFFGAGLFWSTLFIIVTAFLFTVLTTLFSNRKINYIIALVLFGSQWLIMCVQLVYFKVFQVPMAAFSFTTPFQVIEFTNITILTIFKNFFAILLITIPFLLLILFGRKRPDATRARRKYASRVRETAANVVGAVGGWLSPLYRVLDFRRIKLRPKVVLIACMLVSYLFALLCVGLSGGAPTSARTLYFDTSAPEVAQEKLGCLLNMRLDFQRLIFGFEEKGGDEPLPDPSGESSASSAPAPSSEVTPTPTGGATLTPTPAPVNYGENAMDIDFAALAASASDSTIKAMHEYFGSLTPTKKNEMTGIFKDCNFIFMTCESFSRYPAMYPELFPTISKMVKEGLHFTNFYTSAWGVSTTDGEYVACTGLIPKSGVRSFKLSGANYMPFCMGTQFKKAGYPQPYAFHNHTYTFYQREQSHPNMGYKYLGYGNGIEKLTATIDGEEVKIRKTWPESDLQMMQVTLPLYINEDKFHAYYMTVSGHQLYTFSGNYMSGKHKAEVADLDLPDACKAYLACHIELEDALKYLCDELEKAGKLQNTVFVLSPDHYPYGLTNEEISAFLGHTVDPTFELYKADLIIWKPGMENREIDTPMSSLDIMPTISNMFGLEFDSRLFMGQDVFAPNAEPLIIFNTRSWISEKCVYNAKTGEVVQNFTGEPISEDYIKTIKNRIANKFKYSTLILEKNYYAKVFK